MKVRPLCDALGAEITGVDVREPLSDATIERILDVWYEYLVILLRGQTIDEEGQIRFAQRFGPLAIVHTPEFTTRHPAMMLISNIRKDGKAIGALPDGEMQFHSDQCYQERPTRATMLYAVEVPSRGGNTLFANGYKAYEALPENMKRRLDGLRALNVYDYGASAMRRADAVSADAPSFVHPVVRTHPVTKRKALYVNRLMTARIEEMPAEESRLLLEELFNHQERREFVYEHAWRQGDLLIWDNRCTLHARTDFDPNERRLLRRVTIEGERPA